MGPPGNFFLLFGEVANRQIAGQPAVKTDESAFGACQAQSGYADDAGFDCAWYRVGREESISFTVNDRCSHRRPKVQQRKTEKERERERIRREGSYGGGEGCSCWLSYEQPVYINYTLEAHRVRLVMMSSTSD